MNETKSPIDFDSLLDVADHFRDEAVCLKYLEVWFHGGSLKCPHCSCDKIYRFSDGKRFKCAKCRKPFTAKVGTIFSRSTIPMRKWFMAMYLMGTHPKGVASTTLGKLIKVRQATAWFMLQRLRSLLEHGDMKLEGVVSSDEAVVGGRNQNRHKDKRVMFNAGRNFQDKVPVLGMIEKGGKVKNVVLPAMTHRRIRQEVITTVKPGSILVTDEYGAYNKQVKRFYQHEVNNHRKYQYVSKNGYSSNNIENYWSHFKRMIIGIYYKVSRKYLQLYCNEQVFRFNTRHLSAGERFQLIVSKVNYTLKYKQLINNYGQT